MIFTDTSALFALLVVDDLRHPDAVRVHSQVREAREALWTIDPVLTELWLLLYRETRSIRVADENVEALLTRGLRREALWPEDYERAWQIGRDWPDQRFSLTDRQAFAALERNRQLRAWSYDRDFSVVRLGPKRGQALEVLR